MGIEWFMNANEAKLKMYLVQKWVLIMEKVIPSVWRPSWLYVLVSL